MSNPDGGIPALRGGIAKAVFGERYFRMIFWAALRAVSGCAIREKYSGSDFRGRFYQAIFGGYIRSGIPDGIFRVIFRAVLRAVSGCAIREKYSGSDFPRRFRFQGRVGMGSVCSYRPGSGDAWISEEGLG